MATLSAAFAEVRFHVFKSPTLGIIPRSRLFCGISVCFVVVFPFPLCLRLNLFSPVNCATRVEVLQKTHLSLCLFLCLSVSLCLFLCLSVCHCPPLPSLSLYLSVLFLLPLSLSVIFLLLLVLRQFCSRTSSSYVWVCCSLHIL